MDRSTARTAGSYIAICIVEHSQRRGYGEYTLAQARQAVAVHMLKRREYWERVDNGTLRPLLCSGRRQEDYYAAKFSNLDGSWVASTEMNWRGLHGKRPRPFGLS